MITGGPHFRNPAYEGGWVVHPILSNDFAWDKIHRNVGSHLVLIAYNSENELTHDRHTSYWIGPHAAYSGFASWHSSHLTSGNQCLFCSQSANVNVLLKRWILGM